MENYNDNLNEELSEEKQNPTEKKTVVVQQKSLLKEILSLLIYFLIVIAATFLLVRFVAQRTQVIGSSMQSTLSDGDNLIVEKLSYRFGNPQRFDIIVFPYHEDPSKHYIKRIIGLPGETVQIIDGYIYINGELLEENYGNEVIKNAGVAGEPVLLGEDEYFVLGDNRNSSEDSRYSAVGNIERDKIVGRAWLRFWPIKSFGLLGDK